MGWSLDASCFKPCNTYFAFYEPWRMFQTMQYLTTRLVNRIVRFKPCNTNLLTVLLAVSYISNHAMMKLELGRVLWIVCLWTAFYVSNIDSLKGFKMSNFKRRRPIPRLFQIHWCSKMRRFTCFMDRTRCIYFKCTCSWKGSFSPAWSRKRIIFITKLELASNEFKSTVYRIIYWTYWLIICWTFYTVFMSLYAMVSVRWMLFRAHTFFSSESC